MTADEDMELITSGHNHRWEMDKKGNMKFSLGNLTDAGWYWDGDQSDAVGFLVRIANSKVTDEFLNDVKGKISFSKIKPALLKALSKNDGLYEISGDNVRWHFGEGEEIDEDSEKDHLTSDLKYSEDKAEKVIQDAYNYFKTDYDEFAKEYGKSYKDQMKKLINESDSFEEFINKLNSEDVKMTWIENAMEYRDNKWRTAMSQSMSKSKKKLKKVI